MKLLHKRGNYLSGFSAPMVQFVLADLAAQRVAMDAQNHRSARLVALCAFQNPLNEALLELAHGLIEQNAALYHLNDKPFQLISHDFTLPTTEFL
jgi:hypothetical protein